MKQVLQKTRPYLAKKHIGKEVWIQFDDPRGTARYLYPHDGLISLLKARTPGFFQNDSWKEHGWYHWSYIPGETAHKYPYMKSWLANYQIPRV